MIIRNSIRLTCVLIGVLIWSCSDDAAEPEVAAKPIPKQVQTPVYVHFMPWFETPETNNGWWGLHWTMANRDPRMTEADNPDRRQIASHYYPLTGPYASSDPVILEYQVLLMKMSGIDGVLIDFYGTSGYADYPLIMRNTEALMALLPKTGLKYAFVYEDQAAPRAAIMGLVPDAMTQAKFDMRWMGAYFKSEHYIRIAPGNGSSAKDRPLLMVFGPQHFQSPAAWETLNAELPEPTELLTLWYESGEAASTADGEYAWIYQDDRSYVDHLQDFYALDFTGRTRIPVAFPGFRDYYAEGGWGDNLFLIPHDATATFAQTLDMGLATGEPIQLATWNDYGEGTMIEPTVEFGYSFLELLQSRLGVDAGPAELRLAERLYLLRRKHGNHPSIKEKLDTVFGLLVSLQWEEADLQLAALE